MKKFCLLMLMLVIGLSVCACGEPNTSLKEGQLLYDCGATTAKDITKYEFIHKDYLYPDKPIPITDAADQAIFQHYTYDSDFPTTQLHEILIFPRNQFTVTVNEKAFSFYLHEDGRLTMLPWGNTGIRKTYQADEKHRITPEKLAEWILKYDLLKSE